MTACYKAYIKSQLLGSNYELQPMGLFALLLACFSFSALLTNCPQWCSYQLTESQLLLQELLRSLFNMTLIKQHVEKCSDVAITTTMKLQWPALLPNGLQQMWVEAWRKSVTCSNNLTCFTSVIFTFSWLHAYELTALILHTSLS